MFAKFRSLGISNLAFFFLIPSDLKTVMGDMGRKEGLR
jgi:hypothetical protein